MRRSSGKRLSPVRDPLGGPAAHSRVEAFSCPTRQLQSAARHVREHRSVLAAAEKRALIWLAGRMPSRINSDHLSALGLISMLGAGLSFACFRFSPWAAAAVIACLAANWFGDSLDGTVARVRGHQRPRYGFYVDHVIDLAGSAFLLTGLAISGLMSPLFATVLLSAYLLVSAETYLATHAIGRVQDVVSRLRPDRASHPARFGSVEGCRNDRPFNSAPSGRSGCSIVGAIVAVAGLLVTLSRLQHAEHVCPVPRGAAARPAPCTPRWSARRCEGVMKRVPAFIGAGAIGFIIQLSALGLLTIVAGWPYPAATAFAVELAVIHNFVWHQRWTWRDRVDSRTGVLGRFLRYQVTAGATSVAGNLLCTSLLVEQAGIPVVLANVVAVAAMSVANFMLSDRWVFMRRPIAAAMVIAASASPASAAEPKPETIAAWNR